MMNGISYMDTYDDLSSERNDIYQPVCYSYPRVKCENDVEFHAEDQDSACGTSSSVSFEDAANGQMRPHSLNVMPYSPVDNNSSIDSSSPQKTRKRASKIKEEKICGICGDKALGFNFDAITCESCKAFFRRNAHRGPESFKCSNNGNCELDSSNRRFCKRCRLKRCFEIGMKKDYILSEDEKAEKRMKIQQNRIIRRLEDLGWIAKDLIPMEINQRELINEIDIDQLEKLNFAYQHSLKVPITNRQGEKVNPSIGDLVNLAEVSTRRVIAMAKKIEEFRVLPQNDQISLLKTGALEMLILRGIMTYDPQKQVFLEQNDDPDEAVSASDVVFGAGSEVGNSFMELSQSILGELNCNMIEMILLLVICLFSADRITTEPSSKELIDQAQLKYSLLLERYLKTRHTVAKARRNFPIVLKKLCDLREISEEFTKKLDSINPDQVQPLMNELFGLNVRDLQSNASSSQGSGHCFAEQNN